MHVRRRGYTKVKKKCVGCRRGTAKVHYTPARAQHHEHTRQNTKNTIISHESAQKVLQKWSESEQKVLPKCSESGLKVLLKSP